MYGVWKHEVKSQLVEKLCLLMMFKKEISSNMTGKNQLSAMVISEARIDRDL